MRRSRIEGREDDLRQMAQAKWTQKRIASVLGMSQASVSSFMNTRGISHVSRSWRREESPAHPLVALLREERIGRGISQRQLGRDAGYCGSQISDWECGRRLMTVNVLSDLAQAMGYKLCLRPEGA